jgi:hypothetical protein
VDHLATVDARHRRRAVDQRRQHAEPTRDLVEPQHDTRREIAHHRRQAAAADVDDRPARQVGQHHRHQLAERRRRKQPPHRQAGQPGAAKLGLTQAIERRAPLFLAQRHARAHHGAHARIGGDGQPHLGGATGADGVGQHRLRQQLLVGHRDRMAVQGHLGRAREDPDQPVELAGREHTARTAAGHQQPIRLQVALLDLHARGAGRVGDQRRERAVERRLDSGAVAAGAHQHACQPQPVGRARKAIAEAGVGRDRGERWARRRSGLGPRGGRWRRTRCVTPRRHTFRGAPRVGAGRRRAGHRRDIADIAVALLFLGRRRQRNRRRRHVLAGADPRRTVALPFVLGRVEHHRGRHHPAGRTDAQYQLFGRS